ncbi:MAG TPA: acyl-ACP--UDP-N-acetylglucosamine O-acyltransferase [Phycisphaerae bacterium]|nr:acyl-ACP--UDP-N-acetylglucosamine O-acyltransferase [Phycisphaerae bacterium]
MPIHPTAIVDKLAEIHPSAEIGPYVIVDGPVKLAAHVKVYPFAYLAGWTEIGERCEIHPHAVVGHLPQDFHFEGHRSFCRIGAGTIIREGVSIHRGTQPDSWTLVGEDCFLLAGAHVGHNCDVGNNVRLINNSALGGHVSLGDNVIIAGSQVHQFVRIGEFTIVGPGIVVIKDVAPFMKAWDDCVVVSYNGLGLKRSGLFSREDVNEARKAYKMLFRERRPMSRKIEEYAAVAQGKVGARILEFVRGESRMGLAPGRWNAPKNAADSAEE